MTNDILFTVSVTGDEVKIDFPRNCGEKSRGQVLKSKFFCVLIFSVFRKKKRHASLNHHHHLNLSTALHVVM